jgi:hypothetical protein
VEWWPLSGGLGIPYGQTFEVRDSTQGFVGGNEGIHNSVSRQVNGNSQLKRVRGPQTLGVAVLSDQALRYFQSGNFSRRLPECAADGHLPET